MKYGILTNPEQNWALLEIYNVNRFTNNVEAEILITSKNSIWRVGECCDFWNLKQIKLISKKEAEEIMRNKYWQFPKLTVDFDGTLFSVSDDWPKVGKQKLIHKLVANYIRRKHKQGWVVILNTMRENGKGLKEAKQACIDYKIPIDLYNENFQPDIEKWGESRKIGAQLSIDDTQIGLIGWLLRKFG